MANATGTNDLLSLLSILTNSIQTILTTSSSLNKPFPSLDDPILDPSEFTTDGIRNHPTVTENISLIVAAASQLIVMIQSPAMGLMNLVTSSSLPASVSVAEKVHVAEILREAGPKGLHLNELASKTNLDSIKLGKVLRQLASNHCFREIEPNTFVNNAISSMLDSGKSVNDPEFAKNKYKDVETLVPFVSYVTDESFACLPHLREVMVDPETAFSKEGNAAGFQKAFDTKLPYFEWMDLPSNTWRRDRFAMAMKAISLIHPPDAAVAAFDWSTLDDGSLVVDVGGGIGHAMMPVANKFPKLSFAIEDRAEVLEEGKPVWQANFPSRIEEKTIHFVGCDFFEAQPELVKTPDVYFLRMILHDWDPTRATKILRRLREAAGRHTKLVLSEAVIGYACPSDDQQGAAGNGSPPAPLLKNLGAANSFTHAMDIAVLAHLNGGERDIGQWKELIKDGGWKVEWVKSLMGGRNWASSIVCSPA